eukprot:CAMPEP_0170593464 /NCGR_PEP_ID=MMETSP0224-20130122/13464_1 /TAXON_ID=285029 /ORGANISM="Togula jolla, Strain CCCM 725" /LENGTH=40 /DNA_ID= /DNA_START= /DNA_END= /DNA_ORIENTATION=
MSLMGPWPAMGGLPEPAGKDREDRDKGLQDLVQKMLSSKS